MPVDETAITSTPPPFPLLPPQVSLEMGVQPHVLALLMPKFWSDFIRNAPLDDMRELGLAQAAPAA